MRRAPYLVAGIAFVIYGWRQYQHRQLGALDEPGSTPDPASLSVERDPAASRYHCDGRVYCSQMHSCEEATWFLRNCPGVKMDGEGDGVPCERQFCGQH